jgi:SAM-dependent methyltransferase
LVSNPAEGYERFMVPPLFGPWATKLVELAEPTAGERVLDVGCGTGIVARRVAARLGTSGSVTGIDLNPDMLEVARMAAASEGVAVSWQLGSGERLPFPDGCFDLVVSQFALMFFADRAAALAEMRRVIADRGRVLVSVWRGLDRHPFYATLHRAIQARIGISALLDIFSLGSAEELRALMMGAGFRNVEIQPISMTAQFPDPETFLAGEIDVDTAAIPSMQHLDTTARQRIVDAISADMQAPLRDAIRDNRVQIEFHAHIASGQGQ